MADGLWTGSGNKNLSWSGKHITVRSENGPENCIIDCQNSGRGFYFNNSGSGDVVLGFTIRNGYVTGSWPSNCGAGIDCWSNSSPSITNNTISGNILLTKCPFRLIWFIKQSDSYPDKENLKGGG
ncbi:MAG: hypothetical protein AB1297_09460 [bacterium]